MLSEAQSIIERSAVVREGDLKVVIGLAKFRGLPGESYCSQICSCSTDFGSVAATTGAFGPTKHFQARVVHQPGPSSPHQCLES
jgi:hypothetical protein